MSRGVGRAARVAVMACLLLVAARPAGAQAGDAPPSAEPAAEIEALERELDEQLAALATADCALACKALEAMVRAAQRICDLDPGPSCEAARDKVSRASARVREACPECRAAGGLEQRTRAAERPPDVARDERDVHVHGEAAPSPEARGTGCAACRAGGRQETRGAGWWLLALALAAWRRRQR